MSEFTFVAEELLQEAQNKAKLTDFGSNNFKEGVQVLCETYDNNGFNEKGRKRNRRRMLDLLQARLRIEQAFKDYPQILDEEIKAPMLLTGLPRTGTSALLNLLANDTDARPLKLWEAMMPDPCENFQHGQEDPRYLMMKAWQEQQNKKDPEFAKIHHTTADTPEECIHLLNHSFQDVQFGMETMMQPYADWFQQQDLTDSYDYYFKLLQMLQWQRPGQRWLLKSPAHLWALDQLNRLFPDCAIVITHRNPVQAVASYASMMDALMKQRDYDKKTLGPIVMEYLARKMQSSLQQRETIPQTRIFDGQFDDFVKDPVSFACQLYDYFALPISNRTLTAWQDFAKANPLHQHGQHQYDLQAFGLDETCVLDRFKEYIEQFDISVK